MPKRTDIKKILIVGAGPIVIGQACEFDYSGAQACKALRQEGYRIVLVNSNPATIMTDPELADATYIEPVHWRALAQIIEKERPQALLPTMGGQTALNTAVDAAKMGILDKYDVELIGAKLPAINKAEDRAEFKEAMERIGLDVPRSGFANSMEEAREVLPFTVDREQARSAFRDWLGSLGWFRPGDLRTAMLADKVRKPLKAFKSRMAVLPVAINTTIFHSIP